MFITAGSQMHLRQGFAHGMAMRRAGLQLRATFQTIDNSGWFACDAEQDITLGIGLRCRHSDALVGQMLHQVQIKWELLAGESLKQGQNVLALVGGQKIIGVFNAAADAFQRGQLAKRKICQ